MKQILCGYFLLISCTILVDYTSANCERPRKPENGHIIELEDNEDQEFPEGFEINVDCDDGYITDVHGTSCDGENWEKEITDCTPIACSDPGKPDHGTRTGDSFDVGGVVSYTCDEGYHLIGSAERICQSNGRWSGSITVCDDGASDCADPGLPINSIRVGDNFNVGDVVVYSCKKGYAMFGKNATRECLEDGHWSGQPIECYGEKEFSDESEATISIIKTLTMIARKKVLGIGPKNFNIIFLVDDSTRITNRQYNQTREFIKAFVKKIDISPDTSGIHVGVVSYNTRSTINVHVNETDRDVILNAIENMQRKPDNASYLIEALEELYTEFFEKQKKNDSKSIVFWITDGHLTESPEAAGLPVDYFVSVFENMCNASMVALAVGSNPNKQLLLKITPNVLLFSSFRELTNIIRRTLERQRDSEDFICGIREEDTFDQNATDADQHAKKSKHSLSSIIGGQQAIKSWPWMAAFTYTASDPFYDDDDDENKTTQVFCGGTIIHKQWVVSAAHCFNCGGGFWFRGPENWRVIIGKIDVMDDTGLEFGVKEVHCHPNYRRENLYSDVALVKLKSIIPFDHFIRPICLPPYAGDMPNDTLLYKANELATVIGWGKTIGYSIYNLTTYVDEPAITKLNEVEIPIQAEDICLTVVNVTACYSEEYCEPITFSPHEYMVCAGGDVRNACHGDSGGPFMQRVPTYGGKHPGPRWFLSGIVSGGIGCGQKGFYGYYSHVSRLRQFINQVTKIKFEDINLTD